MPSAQQPKFNSQMYSFSGFGIHADPVLGRVYNKFTGDPIAPHINHRKGQTMEIPLPMNMGGHPLGSGRTMRLNRLICWAAWGAPPIYMKRPMAIHKNGDFTDNRGENLMWDSGKYCARQAILSGRLPCKLLPHVGTIRDLATAGMAANLDAVATALNVFTVSAIQNVITGKTFNWLPTEPNPAGVPASILDRLVRQNELWLSRDAAIKREHREAANPQKI